MDDRSSGWTAVQGDPASFTMDWPVFGPPAPADTGFAGRVFVLDRAGARVADGPMSGPGEQAADEALRGLGWTRTAHWCPDDFGRSTARVEHRVAGDQGFLPTRPIASLAEEAALHLG
jgi:hypothetical protein